MKRLKVLVSAYACSPRWGSEPGMGWGWVNALSEYHDLWVITEKGRFEADIETELCKRPDIRKRIKFFYVSHESPRLFMKVWPLSYYRSYKNWQKKTFHLASLLHEKIGFDLVHQLNMIGFREPGYLWKLNAPFVWGPVGGTANVPLCFASILGVREFLYHLARNTFNAYQLRFDRYVNAALAHADSFVTATSDTHDSFLLVKGKDSVVISSTAINAGENYPDRTFGYASGRPLRLVYAGLHVSRKALPIVLRALALLPPKYIWHLDIIGQGAMTKSWQHLARKLGLEKNCTWHGWLPNQNDAVNIISRADVFTFPSLQEGTPTVVIEAVSKAVPVICFDHCGMADVVNETCGIKIPVTAPRQAIIDFAGAIERLAADPEKVKHLSVGAFERAKEFSWHNRVQQMLKVYQQAIEHWQMKNKLEIQIESPRKQKKYEYAGTDSIN